MKLTAGGKHGKVRIIINPAVNVVGLHLFLIGKAAHPQCLGRSGIKVESLYGLAFQILTLGFQGDYSYYITSQPRRKLKNSILKIKLSQVQPQEGWGSATEI